MSTLENPDKSPETQFSDEQAEALKKVASALETIAKNNTDKNTNKNNSNDDNHIRKKESVSTDNKDSGIIIGFLKGINSSLIELVDASTDTKNSIQYLTDITNAQNTAFSDYAKQIIESKKNTIDNGFKVDSDKDGKKNEENTEEGFLVNFLKEAGFGDMVKLINSGVGKALGEAGLILGAAYGGWELGRYISKVTGWEDYISNKIQEVIDNTSVKFNDESSYERTGRYAANAFSIQPNLRTSEDIIKFYNETNPENKAKSVHDAMMGLIYSSNSYNNEDQWMQSLNEIVKELDENQRKWIVDDFNRQKKELEKRKKELEEKQKKLGDKFKDTDDYDKLIKINGKLSNLERYIEFVEDPTNRNFNEKEINDKKESQERDMQNAKTQAEKTEDPLEKDIITGKAKFGDIPDPEVKPNLGFGVSSINEEGSVTTDSGIKELDDLQLWYEDARAGLANASTDDFFAGLSMEKLEKEYENRKSQILAREYRRREYIQNGISEEDVNKILELEDSLFQPQKYRFFNADKFISQYNLTKPGIFDDRKSKKEYAEDPRSWKFKRNPFLKEYFDAQEKVAQLDELANIYPIIKDHEMFNTTPIKALRAGRPRVYGAILNPNETDLRKQKETGSKHIKDLKSRGMTGSIDLDNPDVWGETPIVQPLLDSATNEEVQTQTTNQSDMKELVDAMHENTEQAKKLNETILQVEKNTGTLATAVTKTEIPTATEKYTPSDGE